MSSSTVEGDGRQNSRRQFYFGRKRVAGIKDDDVHIYTFQFGVFKFPAGVNNTDTLYFQPVATVKNDLCLVLGELFMVHG